MDSEAYVKRLDDLEEWLKNGSDCNPMTIADHYSINEKTARNLISRLRERGLNITYSRVLKNYVLRE